MVTVQNEKEEKLLAKVRMMSAEQVDILLSHFDAIVNEEEPNLKAKVEFMEVMKEISKKAIERGITP